MKSIFIFLLLMIPLAAGATNDSTTESERLECERIMSGSFYKVYSLSTNPFKQFLDKTFNMSGPIGFKDRETNLIWHTELRPPNKSYKVMVATYTDKKLAALKENPNYKWILESVPEAFNPDSMIWTKLRTINFVLNATDGAFAPWIVSAFYCADHGLRLATVEEFRQASSNGLGMFLDQKLSDEVIAGTSKRKGLFSTSESVAAGEGNRYPVVFDTSIQGTLIDDRDFVSGLVGNRTLCVSLDKSRPRMPHGAG